MSRTALIGAAIAVMVIAIGAFALMNSATPSESMVVNNEVEGNVTGGEEAPGPDTVPNGTGTGAGGVSGSVDISAGATAAPMSATITYNGTSYSPASVTIKKGGTVTWKNSSGGSMWVASASHPSHTVYDGTSRQEHCAAPSATTFDQCSGQSGDYSFTFTKAGTWGYHDHINASAFGSVNVVE